MEKWKPLNMELRSYVISHILRLEQTSSSLVRVILRLFRDNLKSIGDTSTALSFKSKIDLLYDLDEINKIEYSHLIKLMEIRNQFAHSHNAISFESLDKINADINKYLLKYLPDDTPIEYTREEKLKHSFQKIFMDVCGTLLVRQIEYTDGIGKELDAHINNEVVANIEKIWDDAYKSNQEKFSEDGLTILSTPFYDELELFRSAFRVKMAEFSSKEFSKVRSDLNTVFRKKSTVQERLKKIDEEE